MRKILLLLLFFNDDLGGDGVPNTFFNASLGVHSVTTQRPWGYAYYPFAATAMVRLIQCIFFGTALGIVVKGAEKFFPFHHLRYKNKLKKYMTTKTVVRGNTVVKKGPSPMVLVGYGISSIALWCLYDVLMKMKEHWYLGTLDKQMNTINNAADKKLHGEYGDYCNVLISYFKQKASAAIYDENNYCFTNFQNVTDEMVQNNMNIEPQSDSMTIFYSSSKECIIEVVRQLLLQQKEGSCFSIDFTKLDESESKVDCFVKFWVLLLLKMPLLQKFVPKKYRLQCCLMKQECNAIKDMPMIYFSLVGIKKSSKKPYVIIEMMLKEEDIKNKITNKKEEAPKEEEAPKVNIYTDLYFSHRIAEILDNNLTNGNYYCCLRSYKKQQ